MDGKQQQHRRMVSHPARGAWIELLRSTAVRFVSSLGTAKQRESIRSPSACSLIERRVDEVEILLIHTVLGKAQAFAEAYKME